MRRSFALLVTASILVFAGNAEAITGNAPSAFPGGRHAVIIVGSHGTFCTGVAIARDLVLTAAHCVQPGSDYRLIQFDAARHPQLLDVRAVARHPQFSLRTLFAHRATADVALLKMMQPLPDAILPATLYNGPTPHLGDTLSVFGYGLAVRGEGKTGGVLRMARLVVVGHPGNLQIRLVDPATRGTRPGMGACTGDSGAPVFDASQLIGVVSWSTGPHMTSGCGGLTGVTPLALYRSWIIDTAKKFHSTLVP